MRVVKRLTIALFGLVILLAIVGLFLPTGWGVERTVAISASPVVVRTFLETPRRWPVWSAWNETKYPDMKSTFEGSERGIGAAWVWTGESSGNGRLEITRSDPGGIGYRLAFDEFPPIDGRIALEPGVDGTIVRWSMAGDVGWNLPGRFLASFMGDMMAAELDEGLVKLKGLSEAASPPAPTSVQAKAEAEAPPE